MTLVQLYKNIKWVIISLKVFKRRYGVIHSQTERTFEWLYLPKHTFPKIPLYRKEFPPSVRTLDPLRLSVVPNVSFGYVSQGLNSSRKSQRNTVTDLRSETTPTFLPLNPCRYRTFIPFKGHSLYRQDHSLYRKSSTIRVFDLLPMYSGPFL